MCAFVESHFISIDSPIMPLVFSTIYLIHLRNPVWIRFFSGGYLGNKLVDRDTKVEELAKANKRCKPIIV